MSRGEVRRPRKPGWFYPLTTLGLLMFVVAVSQAVAGRFTTAFLQLAVAAFLLAYPARLWRTAD